MVRKRGSIEGWMNYVVYTLCYIQRKKGRESPLCYKKTQIRITKNEKIYRCISLSDMKDMLGAVANMEYLTVWGFVRERGESGTKVKHI